GGRPSSALSPSRPAACPRARAAPPLAGRGAWVYNDGGMSVPPSSGDVRMTRKPPKTAVVAFKVESELAELLNKLPNKSAFIRKAIAAQLGVACPLCNGKGVVPRGIHDHFAPLLNQLNSRSCDGCGSKL